MGNVTDDLEAVRVVVETLGRFDASDQERIMRWAKEKLGLQVSPPASPPQPEAETQTGASPPHAEHKQPAGHRLDIKTFVAQKNPTSDTQFAATVAYYYRFEAPRDHRKDTIASDDLQDACRKTGRTRLKIPGQTLRNAVSLGLLDKGPERGTFAINTVGENLVAMTLGSENSQASSAKPASRRRGSRKKAAAPLGGSAKKTGGKKSDR